MENTSVGVENPVVRGKGREESTHGRQDREIRPGP